MTIWTGFEGYREPTEAEVVEILKSCPIVLDTNVLLDLYSFEQPARDLALDALESLKSQLFVPHQVMREFWRNRHAVISAIPTPSQPLAQVRGELLGIVNSLRPDRERPKDIEVIRQSIETSLSELTKEIDAARGEPLETKKFLQDTSADPVLQRLEQILDGRIGPAFDAEQEKQLVETGLERFKQKIPPGYQDGKDKSEQVPERGTGDYLLWEQALQHVKNQEKCQEFILVTNDNKEDWRVVLTKPNKQTLGVRPELIAEALETTGAKLTLLGPGDFYRLVNGMRSVDNDASKSLISASDSITESQEQPAAGWTRSAYHLLLQMLTDDGYKVQADVIACAAESAGFASRAQIYEIGGYDGDRSLRRFSLPAQRITLALIDAGELREDVAPALEAVYEGPGRTIGYQVPDDFVGFAALEEGEINGVPVGTPSTTESNN